MDRRAPDSPESDRTWKGSDSINKRTARSTDRGREREYKGERHRESRYKDGDRDYGRERRRRSRSTSRDRDRERRQRRESRRSRSRSRSPIRSHERESEPVSVEKFDELDQDEQEELMKSTMGFSGFNSTKGKHVDGGCNASGVAYSRQKKYRQYMNRRGGFNRMLDHVK